MYRFVVLALAVASINAGYRSSSLAGREARTTSSGYGDRASSYGLGHDLAGSLYGYGSYGSLGYSGYASPYSAGYSAPYSAGFSAPYSTGFVSSHAGGYNSHLGFGLHSPLSGTYNDYNPYGFGWGGKIVR